ncbi:MAG: nitrate transporter substrate-binding protein [Paenibacillaceae bacterium]|jgi:NitT/TauT family transport system substrate-binding protein|nr:nitrate transporter substrate-binding protein [Paenibacillaceae bacterium]
MKRSKYSILAVILVLALSTVLAGCGANNKTAGVEASSPALSPSGAAAANAASAASGTTALPASATTAAPTGAAAKPALDPVKIKIADINTNPVFRTAISKGIFKKYGIEAELVVFATPAEGINSLFIKQVDVAFGAEFPLLNAVSKGDFSIIGATGTANERSASQWRLYVRDGINKPEELKGKKLSNFRGTFVSYLWDKFLAEHNVALKDVSVIGQGGMDEALVALKRGEIDAAWVNGSTLAEKFTAIEGVHQLTDMSQTQVRIGGGFIVPNTLLKEHPDAIANFLLALDETSKFISANQEEVAELLYKEVKLPKEAVLKDLPFNTWEVGFAQQSYDSFVSQKKYMVDNGIIKDDYELGAKINLEPLKRVFPQRVTYK